MVYQADMQRYEKMQYAFCGKTGLQLPLVSLGLWHNFGSVDSFENSRKVLLHAFDSGITHFDLANNYGPVPGSAEETFGLVMQRELQPYRDELIISSKAGYPMWEGPYGNGGSRKYLIASCDQSLKRTKLDYFDIFYHHRPDSETPLEESMGALATIINSGRALYAGISNYPPELARQAAEFMQREYKIKLVIHQFPCNILRQNYIKDGLLEVLDNQGMGGIVFSPLAQGILADRYRDGIPATSRAGRKQYLQPEHITSELQQVTNLLRQVAEERGQTMAQMALSWVLSHKAVTSVLIGASSTAQIDENLKVVNAQTLTQDEMTRIAEIVKDMQV